MYVTKNSKFTWQFPFKICIYFTNIYIYTYIQGMAQLRISSSTVHASYIEKKISTIICRAATATILNYF